MRMLREGDLVKLQTLRDRRLGCRKPVWEMCRNSPSVVVGTLLSCGVEQGGLLSWWDVLVGGTCCEESRIVEGVCMLELQSIWNPVQNRWDCVTIEE